MQFRKYWVAVTGTVTIDGVPKEIRCYGGSDISEEEARADALAKRARVQRRIAGDADAFRDYEPAIREEIIETLDTHNVVTRTRYGALILNSGDTVFVDIDKPPRRFWKSLFAWRGKNDKGRILDHVREVAVLPAWSAYGFRVYETCGGVRAIVSGPAMTPGSPAAAALFTALHADPLYAFLCERQGCFRARLTPKPERAGVKRMAVEFPRDDAQQQALSRWLPVYESASARFGVCRFLAEFGPASCSRIIDLHDLRTQAHRQLPLA